MADSGAGGSSGSSSTTCRSEVWKFFQKKSDPKLVTCSICRVDLAYHGGTSSMKEHLKRKHPVEDSTIGKESTSSRSRKQAKLDVFTKKRSCSPQRAAVISDLIAQVIVKDLRPINMVNGEGFQRLIAYLEPGYHLPSDTHFTHLIERQYSAMKTKVCELLQHKVSYVAVTADVWTSIATDSYLTVTVHYLDDEWAMKSVILGTLPLSESHTGVNLAEWIKDLVLSFCIDDKKVMAFVHDNGANIDCAARSLETELNWYSQGCAGHTLQLCVNAGLKINNTIDRAIGAARCLVTHFRKSEPALRALKSRQADMRSPTHRLIQDVTTRWNSTFFMIERLLEQRWPVTAVLSDSSVTKSSDRYLDLKSEQWDLLEALKVILHPLQVATTYLSAEYNVSVSVLMPVLFGLLRSLEPTVTDLPAIRQCKVEISDQIRRRWHLSCLTESANGDRTTQHIPLMASIVDPRFKHCKFVSTQKQLELKVALTDLVSKEKQTQNSESTDSTQTQSTSCPSGKQPTALDILLGDEQADSADESDPTLYEVDSYLQDRVLNREESPLVWWKANQHRFPQVAQIARKYLCVPATSTPAERVFSTAGLTVTRLRSCLSPEHVNMLVFLNKNSF